MILKMKEINITTTNKKDQINQKEKRTSIFILLLN